MSNGQEQKIIEFEELESEATRVDHSYTANDIQVLEGLEAVRLRPGMYNQCQRSSSSGMGNCR